MYLIHITHIDDRSESVLEQTDVLIYRLSGTLAQLTQLLTCEHRCVHRTEATVQAIDEDTPHRGRFLVLPPMHCSTGEIRNGEANLRSVIWESGTVVRKLLLQFADPIINSKSH